MSYITECLDSFFGNDGKHYSKKNAGGKRLSESSKQHSWTEKVLSEQNMLSRKLDVLELIVALSGAAVLIYWTWS